MVDILERRVQELERRVSELEGNIGFIIPTMRQIHLDLLGFKEEALERFAAVDRRFDTLERKVDALPRAIAETVRDAIKDKG